MTRRRALVAALTACVLAWQAPGAAADGVGPSFDCSKAATATETAICGDAELAALDLAMARAYEALRSARPGELDAIRTAQRTAIAKRDRCGATVRCIASVLADRIGRMLGQTGAAGEAPTEGRYDSVADGITGTMTIGHGSGGSLTADATAVNESSTDQCSASGSLLPEASAGGYGFAGKDGQVVAGLPTLTAFGDLLVLVDSGPGDAGACGADAQWPMVWSLRTAP